MAGSVYILLNPTMPGYLKIGMTTRTPEERAREISQATGVPIPYTVAFAEEVVDCSEAERLIHARLNKYRVNAGREFFHLPLRDAIRELSDIADTVGRPIPTNMEPLPTPDERTPFGEPRTPKPGFRSRLAPAAGEVRKTMVKAVSVYHDKLAQALLPLKGRVIDPTEGRAALIATFPELEGKQEWIILSDHCINHTNRGACECAMTESALLERVGRGRYRVL